MMDIYHINTYSCLAIPKIINFSVRSSPSSLYPGAPSIFWHHSLLLLHKGKVTIEDGQFIIGTECNDRWNSFNLILDIEFFCLIAVDAG